MSTAKRTSHAAALAAEKEGAIRFSRWNWALLAAGAAALVAGFWTLSAGSTVAAPLLLMLGYLVLIPWGIIK
jgi:hypothetical protein